MTNIEQGLRELIEKGEKATAEACERADWDQICRNGGPPCFHFQEDSETFCLRARRWEGHGESRDHAFIPLGDLVRVANLAIPLAKVVLAAEKMLHTIRELCLMDLGEDYESGYKTGSNAAFTQTSIMVKESAAEYDAAIEELKRAMEDSCKV